MLMLYAIYLVIIAINGITECFAFSSMNNSQVDRLFFKYKIIISDKFPQEFSLQIGTGSPSFKFDVAYFHGAIWIYSRKMHRYVYQDKLQVCISFLSYVFSYNHIVKYLNNYAPSINSIMPSLNLVIMLSFSFFVTTISSLVSFFISFSIYFLAIWNYTRLYSYGSPFSGWRNHVPINIMAFILHRAVVFSESPQKDRIRKI